MPAMAPCAATLSIQHPNSARLWPSHTAPSATSFAACCHNRARQTARPFTPPSDTLPPRRSDRKRKRPADMDQGDSCNAKLDQPRRAGAYKKRRASTSKLPASADPFEEALLVANLSLSKAAPTPKPLVFSLAPLSPSVTFVFAPSLHARSLSLPSRSASPGTRSKSASHSLPPPPPRPSFIHIATPSSRSTFPLHYHPQQHRPPVIPASPSSFFLPPFYSSASHSRFGPSLHCTRSLPSVDALGPLERSKKRKTAHRCIRSALLLAGPFALHLQPRSPQCAVTTSTTITDERPSRKRTYKYDGPSMHNREPRWLSTSAAAEGKTSRLCPAEFSCVGSGQAWLRAISRRESRGDVFPSIRLPKLPLIGQDSPELVNHSPTSSQQAPLKSQLLAVLRMRASAGPGEASIRFKKWVFWNAWMRKGMGCHYQPVQTYAPSIAPTGRLVSPSLQVYDENGDLVTDEDDQEFDLDACDYDDDEDLDGLAEEIDVGRSTDSDWGTASTPPLTPSSAGTDTSSSESSSPPTTPEDSEEKHTMVHSTVVTLIEDEENVEAPLSPISPPSLDHSCPTSQAALVTNRQVPILFAPRPKHGKSNSLSSRLEDMAEDNNGNVESISLLQKELSTVSVVTNATIVTSPTSTTHQTPPTPPPSPPKDVTKKASVFVQCRA